MVQQAGEADELPLGGAEFARGGPEALLQRRQGVADDRVFVERRRAGLRPVRQPPPPEGVSTGQGGGTGLLSGGELLGSGLRCGPPALQGAGGALRIRCRRGGDAGQPLLELDQIGRRREGGYEPADPMRSPPDRTDSPRVLRTKGGARRLNRPGSDGGWVVASVGSGGVSL